MNLIQMVRIHRQWDSHTAAKLGLLFLMYISQKVFLTFTATLLPIILRKQGVSLGTIGFAALVYSPWALKFAYASYVDRFYIKRLGKRKSWIVPLLGISWLLLPCLAMLSPADDLATIFVLIFILNFLFATIDIAVDGYATDILKPEERPWGNTIQMVGYLLSYMMGAGLFLIVYQKMGWSQTVLLITALQLVLMLPVILHKEMASVSYGKTFLKSPANPIQKPSMLSLLRQPKALWFLLFLAIITIFEQGGNQLRLPLFVDLGISPSQLGHMNIWIGTPISIMGALMGGALLRRFGSRRVFVLGCLGAAATSLSSALLSQSVSPELWQIALVIGLDKLFIGTICVMTFSMIMTMSVGAQSATNYAVLSSVGHLFHFAIMPISGVICELIGYFSIFLGLAITSLISLFIGDYILRRRLAYSDI